MNSAAKPSLKILTNVWGQKASPIWRSVTTYLPPEGNNLLSHVKSALQLYAKRLGYDCIVLGGGRTAFCFALLQSVLPFPRVPCVMIDCLWYVHQNPLRHFFNKLIRKIVSRSVDKFVVWASREINAYSEAFGISKTKFVFAPFHITVNDLKLTPTEGDYIFSGGNFGRDYDSLIEAVRGLSVKLEIASTRPELFRHISLPDNVHIKGYSHQEFIKTMAGCRINVVTLDASQLHSGGQQTFLNSMWLGKPTIVNDPEGGADYIHHEENGLLVAPKNLPELREAITILINNPEKARTMGTKAREKAKEYTTDHHFQKIVSIAEDVIKNKKILLPDKKRCQLNA